MSNNSISIEALHNLLGIPRDTPLTLDEMCQQLSVAYYPAPQLSVRLQEFCAALVKSMQSLGIRIATEHNALDSSERFAANTVILAPGIFADDALAINRVTTLYNNIIVGIYNEPAPLDTTSLPQARLDAIVSRLAQEMVHVLIYVTDSSWTICTMNGGVVTFHTPLPTKEDVRATLVPKLTAQVVPPKAEAFSCERSSLQPNSAEFAAISDDFMQCSALWSNNSALLTHTSTEGLVCRSPFYKRIVARYLDQRSGMSYGFFARQLPVPVMPAQKENGENAVPITIFGQTLFVSLPEKISVITTRSGCRKHQLNPAQDLVEIGLRFSCGKGEPFIATIAESADAHHIKPSFDTVTILAHALGNAFVASLLMALKPSVQFPYHLAQTGASLTHWHGYPEAEELPDGYFVHGKNNPPVSCSTPQSAVYSLLGKIEALEQALTNNADYHGDVHIEPNHGTNIVGILSLTETAWVMNRG